MSNTSEHSDHAEPRRCVLLVDDDDQVRQMYSVALRAAGFEVVAASTPQQAHHRLDRARPDALVLNLQRSEADGLDVLRRIRARQDLAHIPIVFLAGCASEEFRWRAIGAGADWFGLRPLAMIELQNSIAELIRAGRPPLELFAATAARRIRARRLKPSG
jgi:two-component system OmpR family response regulator